MTCCSLALGDGMSWKGEVTRRSVMLEKRVGGVTPRSDPA